MQEVGGGQRKKGRRLQQSGAATWKVQSDTSTMSYILAHGGLKWETLRRSLMNNVQPEI